jgi:predicted RNA-binding protein with RPS1 domain
MEIGEIINCEIIALKEYGALATIAEGIIGLIHISEISHEYIGHISDRLQIGTCVTAKIIGKTPDGEFRLSLKQVAERTESLKKLDRQIAVPSSQREEAPKGLLEQPVKDWIRDVDIGLRLLRKNRAKRLAETTEPLKMSDTNDKHHR